MKKQAGRKRAAVAVLALLTVAVGCGGSSGDGSNAGVGGVAMSGTVATQAASGSAAVAGAPVETYRVRATGSGGAIFVTETDAGNGRFSLTLPANDSYVMGFDHQGESRDDMHFSGFMVFSCGSGESDHFFVSGRQRSVQLGIVVVSRDRSFARPSLNPLGQMDRDGDGITDQQDPDTDCVDAMDADGDGFYDDDMDRDGHHDCQMKDMMDDNMMDDNMMDDGMMDHDMEGGNCQVPRVAGTATPSPITTNPSRTESPSPPSLASPTMSVVMQGTRTPDAHGH